MDRNYRSHAIPKSTPGEYRIIHEFDNVEDHRRDLRRLRSGIRELSGGYDTAMKINLSGSVHGYPMGNPSMIDLVRGFHDNGGFGPSLRILCSFDLKNFFHSVRPSHVFMSNFWKLYKYCRLGFVDVGNGIEVLSQGSPLSQDISNIVLSEVDIRCMTVCKSINNRFSPDALLRGRLERGDKQERRAARLARNTLSLIKRKNLGSFNHIDLVSEDIASSGGEKTLRVRYMRYVDNIHIICDFAAGYNSRLCMSFAKSVSNSIQAIFCSRGFRTNAKKTNYFSSSANRRMPILGLNTTERVKCKRHYIDGIRAGLHNWVNGNLGYDISPSLMSSAVYVLQSDFHSLNRLRKPVEKMSEIVREAPGFFGNAEALLNFIERKSSTDVAQHEAQASQL